MATEAGAEIPRSDSGFSVACEEFENRVMLVLKGEFDLACVADVERELRRLEVSQELILVDLRNVPFMDSTGLHVLIAADRRMRERGGRLFVVQGGPQIRRLFDLTHASTQLRVVDEPSEAH